MVNIESDLTVFSTKLLIPEQNGSGDLVVLNKMEFDSEEFYKSRNPSYNGEIYTLDTSEPLVYGKDIEEAEKQPRFLLFTLASIMGASRRLPEGENPYDHIDYMNRILEPVMQFGEYTGAEYVEPVYSKSHWDDPKGVPPFSPACFNRPPSRYIEPLEVRVKVHKSLK